MDQGISLWTLLAGGAIVVVSLLLFQALFWRVGYRFVHRLIDRHDLRHVGFSAITIFIIVVLVVAWYGLDRMDRQLREQQGKTLETVNQSSRQALEMWFNSRMREVYSVARDHELLAYSRQLTALQQDFKALRNSPAQEKIREFYRRYAFESEARDFSLIDTQGQIIAGSFENALGQTSALAVHKPALLARVLTGETVFISPLYHNGGVEEPAAHMYLAAPVTEETGRVLAIFVLHYMPADVFTPITRVARMGESGETYLFDGQGRLLTPSRFQQSIERLSRLTGDDSDTVYLRDPGGDTTTGYRPQNMSAKWPMTRMANAALTGNSGVDTEGYRDYRGRPVMGAWMWSERLNMGLASEIDLEEALQPYYAMRTLVMGALAGFAILSLLLTALIIWISERTRDRLQGMVDSRTRELRKLAQAVEQNPLSVLITDINGNIEHVNPTFTRMTGYEADEVLGQTPRVLKSGEMPKQVYEELWRTILAGKVWQSEIRNRKKDGRFYWGSLSIAPVTDEQGTVTHFVGMTEDISDAKEVELALQEAENTRNLALDAAQVGLWSGDVVHDTWTWDQRTHHMLGFGDDIEPDLEKWKEVLHPDDKEQVLQKLAASVQGQQEFSMEFRVLWPDGSARYLSARGKTSCDENKHPRRIDGIVYDVTERKQAADELEAREQQYRNLVETIPGTVYECLIDKNWTMLFISAEIEQLSGYPANEFIQNEVRSFASIIHPDDASHVEEVIATAVACNEDYTVEYRVLDREGDTHYVYERGMATYDEDGNARTLGGTVIDISDRKRAEQQVLDSEARILAATMAANIGLWEYYPLRDEFYTNPTLVTMLGYQAEEFLTSAGQWSRFKGDFNAWKSHIHPQDQACFLEQVELHLKDLTPIYRVEYRARCADGSWKWILDSGRVIERDAQGRAIRGVGIHADIDELKGLQAKLEQARDIAEGATQAKSDFLANMSHEIRTPMNAIIGMSHLALQTELNSRQHNYIEKVHRSAVTLLGIINDILDFSKIEAGKLTMESIHFRLEDVMDNLANLVGLKAEDKGLELMFDLPPDLPTALVGDPLRLGQILINLGNNAVKFTEQGEVVVSVEVLEQDKEQVKLHFTVRDTGIGLSAEQQHKLFESFSQGDSSTTRKFGGTGLGLAICKRLTDMMNGEIWVKSEVGIGSRFHFTVQLQKQQGKLSNRRLPITELGPLRVLVVDDNASAREILCSMLLNMGLHVDQAPTGAQALEMLEQPGDSEPYELVLMDWKMPGMDGVQTIQAIEGKKLIHVPTVIMVTAYDREEAGQATQGLGISSLLHKPVTPSTLFNAIMVAMGQEATMETRVANRQEEAAADIASLRGARILLVEDNEINLELAYELLNNNGLDVEVARNGREALDILEAGRFDGVLMDCQMPVMDGYEATRRLRMNESLQQLPVLAMTANAMAGDREKVLDAGMNDHIAKPINVNEMFHTMARWISPTQPVQGRASVRYTEASMPDVDGIDTKAGLARTQGNTRLYRKLLHKLLENQSDFLEQYDTAVSTHDWSLAQRLSHTLKGVAGNVGAVQLQEASRKLEMLAKQQQTSERARNAVNLELQHILVSIEALEGTEKEPLTTGTSSAEMHKELDTLANQLANYDTSAQDTMEAHSKLFSGKALGPLARKLEKSLNAYDFEKALDVIDKIRAGLVQVQPSATDIADQLDRLLDTLIHKVDEYDATALDELEQGKEILMAAGYAEPYQQLVEALQGYDFDRAKSVLEKILYQTVAVH